MKKYLIIAWTCFYAYSPVYAGMVGVITSWVGVSPGTGATNYEFFQSARGDSWTVTETQVQNVMPQAGSFSYLRVSLQAAPGVGTSWDFTLRINAKSSTLTCSIADTATSCTDVVHSTAVLAGDLITMQTVPHTAPGASTNMRWAAKFTSNNNNEYPLMGGSGTNQTGSATRYYGPQSDSPSTGSTTATGAQGIIPSAGTISNLYAKLDGSAVTGSTYTVTKNGVDSSITCLIPGGSTTCNDTTHILAVVAGDSITFRSDSGTTGRRPSLSMMFAPTTDGESVFIAAPTNIAQSTTNFHSPEASQAWNAVEANRTSLLIAGTLKNLYSGGNPANGQTFETTMSVNASPTALDCTITGLSTACNDIDSLSVNDDDLLSIRGITSATSGTVSSRSGIILFIQPAGGVTVVPQRTLRGIGL